MEKCAKNPLVLAGGAGLIAGVLSFIDHKVNTEGEFTPDYVRYLKISVLVGACTYGALFICCSQCPLKGGACTTATPSSVPEVASTSVNSSTPAPASASAPWSPKGSDVSENIHTGNPNF